MIHSLLYEWRKTNINEMSSNGCLLDKRLHLNCHWWWKQGHCFYAHSMGHLGYYLRWLVACESNSIALLLLDCQWSGEHVDRILWLNLQHRHDSCQLYWFRSRQLYDHQLLVHHNGRPGCQVLIFLQNRTKRNFCHTSIELFEQRKHFVGHLTLAFDIGVSRCFTYSWTVVLIWCGDDDKAKTLIFISNDDHVVRIDKVTLHMRVLNLLRMLRMLVMLQML